MFLPSSLPIIALSSPRLRKSPYSLSGVLVTVNGCGPALKSIMPEPPLVRSPSFALMFLFSTVLVSVLALNHFTLSIDWLLLSVVKNQPRQNQSKSTADASSNVLNKSPGLGCLKAQRSQYSLKALSKSSGPITVSRRMFNAVAHFAYCSLPKFERTTLSELTINGRCKFGSLFMYGTIIDAGPLLAG